jgi:hypothetical protein
VAVVSETVPGALSTQPCRQPIRQWFDRDSPHGWFPVGCGVCDTCRARDAVAV